MEDKQQNLVFDLNLNASEFKNGINKVLGPLDKLNENLKTAQQNADKLASALNNDSFGREVEDFLVKSSNNIVSLIDKIKTLPGMFEKYLKVGELFSKLTTAAKSSKDEVKGITENLEKMGNNSKESINSVTQSLTPVKNGLDSVSTKIKKMPTMLKLSIALVGAELLGDFFKQIGEAYDEQMQRIAGLASRGDKAWEELRYLKQKIEQEQGKGAGQLVKNDVIAEVEAIFEQEYKKKMAEIPASLRNSLKDEVRESIHYELILEKVLAKKKDLIQAYKSEDAQAQRLTNTIANLNKQFNVMPVNPLTRVIGDRTITILSDLEVQEKAYLNIFNNIGKGATMSEANMQRFRLAVIELGKNLGENASPELKKLVANFEAVEKSIREAQAVDDLNTKYSVITKRTLPDFIDQQNRFLKVWKDSNQGINMSRENLKLYITDILNLGKIMGDKATPEFKKLLTEAAKLNAEMSKEQAFKQMLEKYQGYSEESLQIMVENQEAALKVWDEAKFEPGKIKEFKDEVIKVYDTLKRANIVPDEKFAALAERFKKEAENVDKAGKKVEDSLKNIADATNTITDSPQTEKIKKWSDAWDTTAEKIDLASLALSSLKTIVTSIGGKMDKTTESLFGLAEAGIKTAKGLTGIGEGIISKDPTKILTGVVDTVGGIVSGIGSLLGLTEKKIDWGALAADQLRGLPGVTDTMREKLAKLAEEIKDVRKAYRQLMKDFIAEAVSTKFSFEKYAAELANMLNFDKINPNDRQDALGEIGSAFDALIKKADDLQLHGSKAMTDIIEKSRELVGPFQDIKEIQDYVMKQLTTGMEGMTAYLANSADISAKILATREKMAGLDINKDKEEWNTLNTELQTLMENFNKITDQETFDRAAAYAMNFMSALQAEGKSMMDIMSLMGSQLDSLISIRDAGGFEEGILSELLGMREFVKQNEGVINSISGAQKMMESLFNSAYMNSDLFKSFQDDAAQYYELLKGNAEVSKEGLQALAPYLAKMVWYAKEHNMQLEESTLNLIDQAYQQGINMDVMLPPQEKMVLLLEELVRLWGGELPYNIGKAVEEYEKGYGQIIDKTRTWGTELNKVEELFNENLTGAINQFDDEYTNAMSGNTIIKETQKWQSSLDQVDNKISTDLVTSAKQMDGQYKDVMTHIKDYFSQMINDSQGVPLSLRDISRAIMTMTQDIELAKITAAAFGLQIDEELQTKINELTETLGNEHAAVSTLMADIIRNAEIYENNFALFANRTRDIISDLLNGSLTIQETQEAMGNAFNSLLQNAQRLGTEGSKEMISLLKDVRAVGLEVTEIQDYIAGKFDQGAKALGTYVKSFANPDTLKNEIETLTQKLQDNQAKTSSDKLSDKELATLEKERRELEKELSDKKDELQWTVTELSNSWNFMQSSALSMFKALENQGYSTVEILGMMQEPLAGLAQLAADNGLKIGAGIREMTNMAAFVEQNQDLASRIEATRTLMETLGDSAFLTASDFSSFSLQVQEQMRAVTERTDDSKLALRMIAPALENLINYSESYGYTIDDSTQKLIDQAKAQGVLAEKTQSDAEVTNQLLALIAETLGATIPAELDKVTKKAGKSMNSVKNETIAWRDELHNVKSELADDLPVVLENLDDKYTKVMSGNTIIKETAKWKYSLEEVQDILGRELLENADELDKKYKHVQGNIYEYLKKTSAEGFKANLSFDQMVGKLSELQDAYDVLAMKKRRSKRDEDLMDDYKRQIDELKEAIEDTAPTIENLSNRFKDFQETLSSDIGVNASMIKMAQQLRAQGESLEDIDRLIGDSLEKGSRGLADWVKALGPAATEIEEIKKLQEEYQQLLTKGELSDVETKKLTELTDQISVLTAQARQDMNTDTGAILNSQELMAAYFYSLQAEGKSVIDIMELLGDGFKNLADKSLDKTLATPLSETFSQLYQLERKMTENESLISGIQGLGNALHGMGDSMVYLSSETMGSFEQASMQAFDKLKRAGFDQAQALQVMAPVLRDLEAYASEYGYVLSDPIANMLNLAKEAHVLKKQQETDTERLINANLKLAGVMDQMVDVFSRMESVSPFQGLEQQANQFRNNLGLMQRDMPSWVGTDGLALIPGSIWSPEEMQRIQATPVERMNLADSHTARNGDIVFEHITIQSENGEETVREFMTAIKGNKYGVQNLIRKVAN